MSTLWFIVAYNYGQCVAVQVLCGLLWLCNEIHLWAMQRDYGDCPVLYKGCFPMHIIKLSHSACFTVGIKSVISV